MKKTFFAIMPIPFIVAISIFLLLGLLQQSVQAATLTVTKTADSNDGSCNADCSLREAVNAANNGDTIYFANSLSGMTLTLATAVSINKAITIDGSTLPARATIQMIGGEKILATSNIVVLNSLIFKDGLVDGAIYNTGDLTLNNAHFENNMTNIGNGGAINNEGTLTINQSTFINNRSDNWGGAIYNKIAITSNSPRDTLVKISDSTFIQNTALHGGAIMNEFDIEYTPPTGPETTLSPQGFISPSSLGYVEILNSSIANNSATGNGGGILTFVSQKEVAAAVAQQVEAPLGAGGFPSYGIVYILASAIVSNTAVSYGGGIHNTVITPTLMAAAETPLANHTFNGYAAVIIDQATIANNSADYGAGIANTTRDSCIASVNNPQTISALPSENILIGLYDSLIENNSANINGGGLFMGDETACAPPPPATPPIPDIAIGSSTFVNNRANVGGGFYNKNGRIVVGNSTFSANSGDMGAAVVNLSSTELWHTTLYTNTIVPAPASVTIQEPNGVTTPTGSLFNNGSLRIVNTIIAGTNGPADEDCVSVSGLANGQNNIILIGTSCINGSITVDPLLQPLAKILGNTPTHAIASNSSALDVADIVGCGHYLVGNRDQRGLERPISDGDGGGLCDIGAYEYLDIFTSYLPVVLNN